MHVETSTIALNPTVQYTTTEFELTQSSTVS